LVKNVPEYFTSKEYRPHCEDSRKFQLIEELKEKLKGEHNIMELDGVKVIFEDGWAIFRVSNTAPQLVVRWESTTKEGKERIGSFVKEQLDSFGIKLE
jgi:phosphomannomutase/phosphoglucomutase